MVKRNLDGCYFRVLREGKAHGICFTDLTHRERDEVTEGRSAEWLRSLCYHLADVIQAIGEEFDIYEEE